MKGRIASSTIAMVMRVEPVQQQAAATPQPVQGRPSATALPPLPQRRAQQTIETHGESPTASGGQGGTVVQNQTAPIVRAGPRVGRNDPCPCGSGKKYKKCHLPLEEGGAPAE
jgi:preprotein translocase subunit SecA